MKNLIRLIEGNYFLAFVIAIFIGGIGCNIKEKAPAKIVQELRSADPALTNLLARVEALDQEIGFLKESLRKDQQQISERLTRLGVQLSATKAQLLANDSCTLQPALKGYQKIETTVGSLLLTVKNVESYLDGFKILIDIGNPNFITFRGLKMTINWGNSIPAAGDFLSKENVFDLTNTLLPGRWNQIEVILSPATPSDIKMLVVKIETSEVVFLN